MKTITDVFEAFKQALSGLYESREVESITLLTINEIINLSKATIKAFPEKELSAGQAGQLENILAQLQSGQPIQYIFGHTEFYGLKFLVNPSVLIPRPETEELVEWIIQSMVNSQWSTGNKDDGILDIGTGSGCIAISLKKHLPNANISAMDISPEALQIAGENAKLNDVTIDFIQADILTPPNSPLKTHYSLLKTQNSPLTTHHSPLTTPYSLIVSNPPYVTLHDKAQMHINVTDFEPHLALFVPEADPLIFYRAIADFAANNLINNGLLFFEINESYGKETVDLLVTKGFKNIELKMDMSGKDRMIKATFKKN